MEKYIPAILPTQPTQPWTTSLAKGLLPMVLIWPQSKPALTEATAAAYSEEGPLAPTNATTATYQAKYVPRFIVPAQQRREPHSLRSVAADLKHIRSTFALKMSEVAEIFNVSRPAVYAWLDGAIPKQDVLTRLMLLSKQAEQVNQAGINRLEHFLRRPLADGRSLLQLLKEGANIEHALSTIKQAAAEEELSRKLAVSRHSPTKKGDAASIDELSVPIVPES